MKVPLTNSHLAAWLDDEDAHLLYGRSWFVDSEGYVGSNSSRKTGARRRVRLHRLLLNATKGHIVDHINRNKLDNRRANLRFVTHSENTFNSDTRPTSVSQYKGVSKKRNKWRAYISHHGKYVHIGHFETEHQAALAHDLWACVNEFIPLNFQDAHHS
jgi:hypothetical protein